MLEADRSVWSGRIDGADGPAALRWHQMVQPWAAGVPPGLVLIGFACDEGVRRNGGRGGAKEGPRAIRATLANFAWHQNAPVYDAGDVPCPDGDLEKAQDTLAEVVAAALRAGHRPLVLGGGHETAWGTFQGIHQAKPAVAISIVNIDAHLDLRADQPGHSGTPFSQIARWGAAHRQPFRYLCIGAAQPANTRALYQRLKDWGGEFIPDTDFWPLPRADALAAIADYVAGAEAIHLSIDLDVLSAAIMPAVSAPAARGLALEAVELVMERVMASKKVVAVDLVELNPRFDIDNRGCRVAARLAWGIAHAWEGQEDDA
jgi:formiminoglutamase